ncbi:MAG: PRD domain-containing protein, partial [Erysipelotrichaceae bacterium]
MEILSERMKVLLDHLIKNKEVSSEVLAVYANVTPRTIKSDIQKMQSILKPYGSEIISRRGHGYRLQINDETAFAVLRTFLKNNNENEMLDVPKTRFERVAYLMRKLLMIDYPIKIEELADEVFVSRQMLSADIKELRRLLYNYELEIVSNNEGIMISGNEILKRRCINDAFFQKNNQDFFVQNHTMFSSEMNQKEIRFIREALLNVLNKHSIRFSDFSVQNMVIHIMISIRRYQFYQYVSISNEKEIIIKNGPYYEVAFDLAKKIENNFSVEFPQDEIVYLAMHIQSKSIIGNENVVKENTDVDELLYHIYKRIKVRFNISFFLNHELNEFLKLHIPSMV